MNSRSKSDHIIQYEGPVKFETIGNLINLLKEKMKNMGVKVVVYKKILLVLIETLENIHKYSEFNDSNDIIDTEYYPKFFLRKEKDKYIILTSNAIKKRDKKRIEDKISKLNSLNSEGLRALYKMTITNGQFSSKGGAGLGFIEIAKIVHDKMEFWFQPINNDLSYYNLKITVKG